MIKVRWSVIGTHRPAHKRNIVVVGERDIDNNLNLVVMSMTEAERLVKDLNKKIALMKASLGKEIRDSFSKPDTNLLYTKIPTPVEPSYVDPRSSCAICEYSVLGMFGKSCDNCKRRD